MIFFKSRVIFRKVVVLTALFLTILSHGGIVICREFAKYAAKGRRLAITSATPREEREERSKPTFRRSPIFREAKPLPVTFARDALKPLKELK